MVVQGQIGERHLIAGPEHIPLYVETFGNPDTATYTLVCIHGALQSLQCWREQYAFFCERDAYIIAMDLPWHGESNPIPHHISATPELWADSVSTVLQKFRLSNRPVFLMCWSFGGFVVRHYFHYYGLDGISGLISVASLLAGIRALEQHSEEDETTTITAALLSPNLFYELRATSLDQFVHLLTKDQPPLPEFYYTYGYNAKALLTIGKQGLSLLNDIPDDATNFLQDIHLPTLLIQGQEDALCGSQFAEYTADLLPQGKLLSYEDCGHSPFLEFPERFNNDVLLFIQGVLRTD